MTEIAPVVVYPSRQRVFWVVLLGLGMSAAFVWVLASPNLIGRFSLSLRLCVWAGAVFFPLGAIYHLVRLLRPTPCLIVDERGVTDNASATSVGFVGWEEISGFQILTLAGNRFLVVEAADPAAVLGRLPLWKRWVKRGDAALAGSPICLPQTMLPVSVDELRLKMEMMRRVRLGEESAQAAED
jgi:hypothetical protein